MRVLLINKFFFPNAGAESVFFATRALLKHRGHEVIDFAMQHERNLPSAYEEFFAPRREYDEGSFWTRSRHALATIYSTSARRSLRRLFERVGIPDVAHLHNVYHQLTLSVVDELHAHGIPVVLTVHDYKPVCPNYELFTKAQVCHRCVGDHPLHAIRHRCVKGSLAASTIAAVEALVVRARSLYESVEQFVTPSSFAADLLRQAGISSQRIRVIPNFVSVPSSQPPAPDPGAPLIFAGRLEHVKGVELLLEAMRILGEAAPPLRILGDGPLATRLHAGSEGLPVELVGFVPRERVAEEVRRARALVMPSLWEENCPMSLLEARAAGTPVIASRIGGLPELVTDGEDGILFRAGDPSDLARAIQRLDETGGQVEALREASWRRARESHSPDGHYEALMEAYADAMGRAQEVA